MFRSQGRHFTSEELEKITVFLRTTDLALSEIAARLCCSRSAIAAINRKLRIRDYKGLRTRWVSNPETEVSQS
jgi:hypothetical protein